MSVFCLCSPCWDSLTCQRVSRDRTTNGSTPNSRRMRKSPSTSDSLRKYYSWDIRAEISDQTHSLPVARKGITATPAAVDYEGRPAFLVDASVYPGSRGSPVFIYNTDGWTNGSGHLAAGSRVMFSGVLAAVPYREEDGVIEFGEVPAALHARVSTRQMIDLGVEFKARTITEAIKTSLQQMGLLAPGQPMSAGSAKPMKWVAGEEHIVAPTVYHAHYLSVLKALFQSGPP